MEPSWLNIARSYQGLREIAGAPTEPRIAKWLAQLGAWWRDDETPWCGTFVAAVMQQAAVAPPLPKAWYRARGWLDWGFPLPEPVVGCVTVLERPGGGHVFFTLGRDSRGHLVGVGGNQGNEVRVDVFSPARVLGHRWPLSKITLLHLMPADLPLLAATGEPSRNEA